MKKTALIIIIILITSISYADEIIVPFSCYPRETVKVFERTGRKLDLDRNDRTPDSWGFIWNEGSRFKIYTYEPATEEDFNTIKDIIFGRIK